MPKHGEKPGRSQVALATGKDAGEATHQAVEKLGGIKKFVKPGDRVFIKPNMATPTQAPTTTSFDVLAALIKMCREAEAGKISVGDAPTISIKSEYVMDLTGLADFVKWFGAEPFYFDKEEMVEVENPKAKNKKLRSLKLPKTVAECDVFINVPVAKTSLMTDVSLALTNLHGVYTHDYRGIYHLNEREFAHKIADLCEVMQPDLNVLDGWWMGEGEGPWLMNFVQGKFVLASEDLVAIDSVASHLMGFKSPRDIILLRIANERGLGEINLENIKILGEDPKKYKKDLVKASKGLVKVPKGVKAYKGKTQRGTLMTLNFLLTAMNWWFPALSFDLVVGEKPPEPEESDKPIIVWGSDAVKSTTNYKFRKGKRIVVDVDKNPPLTPYWEDEKSTIEMCGKTDLKPIITQTMPPILVDIMDLLQGNQLRFWPLCLHAYKENLVKGERW
ncbi:MAG TPA: DUF362 domain-containing protein [Thermoplasmata archaeon]|nr:DUF362 domain-containing protein [Thermoplasmata archaeon]